MYTKKKTYKRVNYKSKKTKKVLKGGNKICNSKDDDKNEYFEIFVNKFLDDSYQSKNKLIQEQVEDHLKSIPLDPLLFTEIMNDLFNHCFSEKNVDEKIHSMALFKNKNTSKFLDMKYIDTLIELLTDYPLTVSCCDKHVEMIIEHRKKMNENLSYDSNGTNKEVDNLINAENLLILFKNAKFNNQKRNINKFIEIFLTNSEYTNIIMKPETYYVELIIEKLGNIMREVLVLGDVIGKDE